MRKVFHYLHVSGLLLVPLVLVVLPADFFDEGQSVCVSVLLFDQACYGCGMTRAIQHLLHLDFMTAYVFNKLSAVVLPVLMLVWFGELRRVYNKIKAAQS